MITCSDTEQFHTLTLITWSDTEQFHTLTLITCSDTEQFHTLTLITCSDTEQFHTLTLITCSDTEQFHTLTFFTLKTSLSGILAKITAVLPCERKGTTSVVSLAPQTLQYHWLTKPWCLKVTRK